LQLYLSVTPDHCRHALKYHNRLAHAAYRIGSDSRLLRSALPPQVRGGILSLSDRSAPEIAYPERLCREIWQECFQRSFSGVLADFEQPPTEDRMGFLARLCTLLQHNKRRLYLPEKFYLKGAVPVICTALSGGNLKERLEEALDRAASGQAALDLQRLAMDFPLPCPSGDGRPLGRTELAGLMTTFSPLSFYSSDLAAKYFTYTKNGSHHFVLYDDAHTIREKIRLGQSMGFCTAFLMYPEVEDILPALFPK